MSKSANNWDHDYLTDSEFEIFSEIITKLLKKFLKGKVYSIDFDKGIVKIDNEESNLLFLDNTARYAKRFNYNEWERTIDEQIRRMLSTYEYQDSDLEKQMDNLNIAKAYLLPRIRNTSELSNELLRSEFIWREDIPNTYTLLSLDLPEIFVSAELLFLTLWDKTIEEVFEVAITNLTNKLGKIKTEKFPVGSTNFDLFYCENYGSGASLIIDKLTHLHGKAGVLFGIPQRDGLITLPVDEECFNEKDLNNLFGYRQYLVGRLLCMYCRIKR